MTTIEAPKGATRRNTVGRAVALVLATLLAPQVARAQDKGTLNPQPLPPLAKPDDPATPAKELFGRKSAPANLQTRTIACACSAPSASHSTAIAACWSAGRWPRADWRSAISDPTARSNPTRRRSNACSRSPAARQIFSATASSASPTPTAGGRKPLPRVSRRERDGNASPSAGRLRAMCSVPAAFRLTGGIPRFTRQPHCGARRRIESA